jgi:hypothetical protein
LLEGSSFPLTVLLANIILAVANRAERTGSLIRVLVLPVPSGEGTPLPEQSYTEKEVGMAYRAEHDFPHGKARSPNLTSISLLGIILVGASSPFNALAQIQWSPATQLTFGQADDRHHLFVEKPSPGGEELLAFTRSDILSKSICVVKTEQSGAVWGTSVDYITSDSIDDDFPSIAGDPFFKKYLVVWQRCEALCGIFYSVNNGAGWSTPARLTAPSVDAQQPRLAFKRDASPPFHIGAVWEESGRIVHAEFRDSAWTAPEFVTPEGDTTNHEPQINYVKRLLGEWQPLVVWEKRIGQLPRRVYHSFKNDTGWVQLGDVVGGMSDDNRSPKFVKNLRGPSFAITYSVTPPGFRSEIYGAAGEYSGPTPLFSAFTTFTRNPSTDHGNSSFTFNPIVTVNDEPLESILYWHTAGTWHTSLNASDSIALLHFGLQDPVYRIVQPGAADQHPDISSGTYVSSAMRVWSVWESNASGSWKLYGSTADIPVDVPEEGSLPRVVKLFQNYPNPFNPSTTFRFYIQHSAFIIFKVYDLLGCEVATLVNGSKPAGGHEVVWDATGMASGVYFYTLQTSDAKKVLIRKMVLLR